MARFAAVVDAMLAARAASRRSLATLRLVSAPIKGPEMAGAAGVVEQAEGDLAKGDLVFAPTLRCAWGDAATVKVDAKALVKVPPSVPPAQAAHLGAAAAAAALLDGAVAGDVVLHLGGEGAVGQVAAQLCAARGVSLVSLVGADVADAEDAVEVLKNLGAVCAAPAAFARTPTFRGVVADLGAPSLLLVDAANIDAPAVNALLDAEGAAARRGALAAAHAVDVRDAKLLAACAALLAPGAKVVAYDSTTGPISGADAFDGGAVDAKAAAAAADAVASHGVAVLSEAHTTATLPRALHVANGAVYKHAFRQPLWLAEPLE